MTQYLEAPIAQGPETFSANGGENKVVLNGSSINILYDVLTNVKGVEFTGTGFNYNDGTTITSVTWANLKSMAALLPTLVASGDPEIITVTDQLRITNSQQTSSIVFSARGGVNQIFLNGSAGTTGQVLTNSGSTGLEWTTIPTSTIHASVQIVSSTMPSPPVTTLDINNPNGFVFITAVPASPIYYLPTGMKAGYMVSIRNNSGSTWKISVALPTENNGLIYTSGTGVVEISVLNATSTFFLKYIGVINNIPTWIG
jgi:hypothetical protein